MNTDALSISRAALASTSPEPGAALVGMRNGLNLDGLLFGARAMALVRGRKPFARSWAEAVAMCDDNSAMIGYAALAGTTGGAGKPVYKVWNAADDIDRAGSLRWAVAQAVTSGGGRIIFTPVGKFNIRLKSLLNITVDNITLDAPGRNVKIRALNDVEMIRVSSKNVILKRLNTGRLPHYTHVDGDNIYEEDGISINPVLADKVWVHECTFAEHSDGALDCASSALASGASPVRLTVSNNLFRRQDKTMILGSSATSLDPAPAWAPTALAEPPVMFVTLANNVFDGAAQRSPRAGALCFVHSLNNLHEIGSYQRDDGTSSAAYGAIATTGGKILSSGDYLRLASPTVGARGIYAETSAWNDATNTGPGAVKFEGTVAEDELDIVATNDSYVPTPAYTYTPVAIPADAPGRAAWAASVYAAAGAAVNVGAELEYTYVSKAEGDAAGIYPDGYHVITGENGYLIRTEDDVEALDFADESAQSEVLVLPRGSTKTIASDAITVDADTSHYAVDTEGAAATDNLSTINGGVDGQELRLRAASSARSFYLVSGGNIDLTGTQQVKVTNTKVVGLIWDATNTRWKLLSASVEDTLESGTYTPVVSDTTNCDTTPTATAFYRRNGSVVQVNGTVTVDATASGDTMFRLTLPITSNLAATNDLSGQAIAYSSAAISGGAIIGSVADDKAQFRINATSTSVRDYTFSFSYRVL